MVAQVLGTIKNAIVVWIGIIFLQELVTKLQVSTECFASQNGTYPKQYLLDVARLVLS